MRGFRYILSLCAICLIPQILLSQGSCIATVYAGTDSTVCYSNNVVYLNGVVIRTNGQLQTTNCTWSGGNGEFSPSNTNLTTAYIPTKSESDAGQVTLILTATRWGCTTKRDTVTITIRKVTTGSIDGPATTCAFAEQTYSVSQTSGITYDWHVLGGTVLQGGGTSSIEVSWGSSGPGSLYLVRTDNLGCYSITGLNTLAQYDFNTSDLEEAEVGSDANSYDSDVEPTGQGLTIRNNCGGTKGLDLDIPGSSFNRGKMCMSFNWQRDESEAGFFKRGGTEFTISGGVLYAKLTQYNGSGGSQVVGPVSTGYTIPNDDVFRTFTFCYDSATGLARVMINDSLIWSYQTPYQTSLYWTGAGNAEIGLLMDGNCVGNTLLNWALITLPVTILPNPTGTLSGPQSVCRNETAVYVTDTPSGTDFLWTPTGGNITGSQTGPGAQVLWNQAGNRTVQLELTGTLHGCDTLLSLAVQVNDLPDPLISLNDSLCAGDHAAATASGTGLVYAWSNTYNSQTSSLDSIALDWDSSGQYYLYLESEDTLTSCLNTDTIPVWVMDYPVPLMVGSTIHCLGQAELIEVQQADGMNYTWSSPDGNILGGQGSVEISIQHATSGNKTVYLEVTHPEFGCTTEATFQYQVMPRPVTDGIYTD